MNNTTKPMHVFEHPGILCKAIRELRLPVLKEPPLTLQAMARRYGISVRMLQFFESGKRPLSEYIFDAYIHDLTDVPADITQLQTLYLSYQNRGTLSSNLAHYNFHTITRHHLLQPLLRRLEKLRSPAFIMDDLAFCSVMNAQLTALFHIDPGALANPHLWHTVSTLLDPASPVRKAHAAPPNAYFAFAVRKFHQGLAKYFFTAQSLELQRRLLTLAPHEYGKHWSAYLLLTEPEWPAVPFRVMRAHHERSQWRMQKLETVAVQITHGPVLYYHLFEWVPADEMADLICRKELAQIRPELLFAREFGLTEYEFV